MKRNFFTRTVSPISRSLDRLGVVHPIARYMIIHWVLGMAAGLFCAAALLWINPLGLRTLLFRSNALVPGLILLFVGFSTLFGAIICATAVMFPESGNGEAGGRKQLATAKLAVVKRPLEHHPAKRDRLVDKMTL